MNRHETPLVTIVMPAYNEEHTVAKAVASALRQTVQSTEVLVIDGCSEDATRDVVGALTLEEPRLRLLSNPKRNIASALNIGLSQARGQFVSRVDTHLTINDSYIETGLKVLAEHPDVAAVGGCRVGVARTKTGQAIAAALSSPFGVGDSINHFAREPQETDHASMGVYRTEVLRAVGGWDENLLAAEDVDIDHRILAIGHKIRYHPDMVMHWSVRETLRDFGRQYRRYGRGKAGTVRKNGVAAGRPRHLAPPGLLVALVAGGAALLTGRRRAAAVLLLPYPVGLTVAVRATHWPSQGTVGGQLRLAGAFATMHLAWGFGFLEGILFRATPATASGRAPKGGTRDPSGPANGTGSNTDSSHRSP